jgi:uncharacterized zinc-type alcohol dehydrogenase-like protein
MKTIGYAVHGADAAFVPYEFDRRELRPNDVAIEVLYCGVCHTDLHMARNDWGGTNYPFVPGHEFVGRVVAVGKDVTRHAEGDHVAVGCMIDSCQHCDQCHAGEEQLCREGHTNTYNDMDRVDGTKTYGGYSKHVMVREEFVLQVPSGLDLSRAAPLLCAGITSYSPLRTWGVGPGSRVGVIGLGGLGHMAVKLAVAMGADVTVLSRSVQKEADALALGADRLLVSSHAEAMAAAASSLDLIVDTVPAKHDVNPYLPLLDVDGTLVVVGQVGPLAEPSTVPMLFGRRRIAGSVIGGIAETQELLNFCAKAGVLPDCEIIGIADLDAAFERLARSDVRYRFVIDMATLSNP